ncbi:ubiquinol-cytochrome C chaperone family protein [Kordiimonas marina]|uniref:ubiquinol-cytochrome C chaperone family protein n=1 Tax=Kordiimonas marina TaxID=2872312 RepID=UPI001FF1770D|nr:ubiquinol-cytochrome C chaperone family protein [Kordiimonas marina]MCJ9430406.1 hypothetical protein [Kordiimonas marina]
MFGRWLKNRQEKKLAYRLYQKLATQSREPIFYTRLGVPDTFDGRFDMVLLHLFLVQSRLEDFGTETRTLRRKVQEAMVADLDRALREVGVGDMSVGKEMKKVGSAWFGRLNAYGAAVEDDAEEGALKVALKRNLYREDADDALLDAMTEYVETTRAKLAGYGLEAFLAVSFDFPTPDGGEAAQVQGQG